MIINMLNSKYDHKYATFERSYDNFMILSYEKVMITNKFRLRLF